MKIHLFPSTRPKNGVSTGKGKRGENGKKNSMHGKYREFYFEYEFRENTGNFLKISKTHEIERILFPATGDF